jgi:hypothetical protein
VSIYVEICHCSNAKSSHHEGTGACLAVGCNDCPRYCDRNLPDTREKPPPERPDHAYWCQCARCKVAGPPTKKDDDEEAA